MLNYLVRRILLMIPTLIGITILVFLIARFAPGRPGQSQLEGSGLGAEEAKALAEWWEKRYGLDLPLWEQYLRWWGGMFTRDIQAQAWFDDGTQLLPVFTYRKAEPQYFARAANGSWFAVKVTATEPATYRLDDPTFVQRIESGQLAEHPQRKAGYDDPLHAVVAATFVPIESLDEVKAEALKRATQPINVPVRALAWSDPGGEPLYVNPADPLRPLVRRGEAWHVMTPSLPLENSLINSIDAPATAALLKARMDELPAADDDYAIPRHAFVQGKTEPIDGTFDEQQLERLTIEASAKSPAGMWALIPGTERATMLYEPAKPSPRLLVQVQGTWYRLFGATRAQMPDDSIVRQSHRRFQDRLSEPDRAALPETKDATREPRYAMLTGTLTPLDEGEPPPQPRDIRRYQHETNIFEVTLGMTLQNETVMTELKRRLPITLMLNFIAFPLIYLIAIPAGMLMAVKRGKGFDTSANVSMLGLWSVPQVLAATLLIGYLAVGGAGLHLFPASGLSSVGSESLPFFGTFQEDGSFRAGWLLDRFWHLVLPVFCIVYGSFAYIAKQQRAAMLDNFTMDYVRTAKAKGVPGKDIVFRHVLRNSLLPLITIFATVLPALIAGSIILEKIFNIEGMGLLAFRAVQNRDYDVVQSLALIAGSLNLIGLLLADICYALADPRITYK